MKYLESPIFYMGNKYKLLKQLIPLFPSKCDTFLDLYLEQRYSMKIFKSRIKQLEEDNYKQYKEIEKLKKENEWLKNHQKIEIVNLNK